MSLIHKIFGAPQPAAPLAAQAPAAVPEAPAAPESPLGKFDKVWEPNAVDPNAAQQPAQADANSIMEAAKKVDFSKSLNQAELAKISAGGPDAVAALANILNSQAQQVYGQSAFATSKIVEQAVAKAREEFVAQLPQLVNQQSSRDLLNQQTDVFKNPAVAPVVEMVHSQILQKYPNASPTEIAAMTREMMQGMAQVFAPAPAKVDTAPKGDDWSSYA